jgi:hypothetical protein
MGHVSEGERFFQSPIVSKLPNEFGKISSWCRFNLIIISGSSMNYGRPYGAVFFTFHINID